MPSYTIKNKIEAQLKSHIRSLDKSFSLRKISPLLSKSIKDFVLRKGKRLRPTLLVIGYLGFAKRPAPNLYKTALSIELLHDFMLIHDDIIDKSDTRRGRPSLHKKLGQNLAIVCGDVLYALAIDTFLSIKENMQRKEKALRKFIQAAIYTQMGEFIELLSEAKGIEKVTKQDIYRIYDYKSAHYSFASPLSMGAILAAAKQSEVNRLDKYGMHLGRAFQIKDDILGIFGEEKKTGKSPLTDLQEGKKTILIWYAYNHSNWQDKSVIKRIFKKDNINKRDLLKMRKIISACGALDYAKNEVSALLRKAQITLKSSKMRPEYKTFLAGYSQELLKL